MYIECMYVVVIQRHLAQCLGKQVLEKAPGHSGKKCYRKTQCSLIIDY